MTIIIIRQRHTQQCGTPMVNESKNKWWNRLCCRFVGSTLERDEQWGKKKNDNFGTFPFTWEDSWANHKEHEDPSHSDVVSGLILLFNASAERWDNESKWTRLGLKRLTYQKQIFFGDDFLWVRTWFTLLWHLPERKQANPCWAYNWKVRRPL